MRQQLKLPKHLDGKLWHYSPRGRNAMHRHAELELNLITSGRGLYLLENRKYEIRRGDLLWLFPAQEHVLVEQSPDFEMWIGVFKPKAVRQSASDANSSILRQSNPSGEFCRRLAQPTTAWLDKLFVEIAASESQPALYNRGLGYALLAAWDQFSHAREIPIQDVHPAVERAARHLRDADHTLNVAELARHAGLSAPRLSRLFKQQTGVNLVAFRNRQRIEKFFAIYGTGQRSTMLDAALAAGFGSYAQFHRVFKRLTGISPGRYRKRPDA